MDQNGEEEGAFSWKCNSTVNWQELLSALNIAKTFHQLNKNYAACISCIR